jgi:hypothetical protein
MPFVSVDELFRSQVEPAKHHSSMSTLEESRSSSDHLSIIREGGSAIMNDLPLEPCGFALPISATIHPAQNTSVPHLAAASLFGGSPVVTPNISWQRAHMPANVIILDLPESPGSEA